MTPHMFQRGMSMLIALIALVAMSLTAVALVRSVDTGALIIGNYSFKQDATEGSSSSAETAMQWISANQGALNNDDPNNGYYASSLPTLDATGNSTTSDRPLDLVDWDGDGNCSYAQAGSFSTCSHQVFPTARNVVAVNGNTNQWIITRLCQNVGPPGALNPCLTPGAVAVVVASDRGELIAGGRIASSPQSPYYRIVVRSVGPRNTVSFTETIAHL